jgi:hypothetical protein
MVRVLDECGPKRAPEIEARQILTLAVGPGSYLLRVHARGRSNARAIQGSADHAETMLVQFWPE